VAATVAVGLGAIVGVGEVAGVALGVGLGAGLGLAVGVGDGFGVGLGLAAGAFKAVARKRQRAPVRKARRKKRLFEGVVFTVNGDAMVGYEGSSGR
jgi:hypothetical protein